MMRTYLQIIAATLGMIALQSTASADDQNVNAFDRALHRSIAMQGDQALLNIRASAVDAISQSISYQMAYALSSESTASWVGDSEPDCRDIKLAALTLNH